MSAFFLFLFLFLFHGAQAQKVHSNISLGSSLTPAQNSSWLSPSGLYAFGFYNQRNGFGVGIFLAGIPEKTVVWTANRDDDPTVPDNATLLLTTDGRLILKAQDREIDIADTIDIIASASMLDTGNFVLYNKDQNITWQSFDYPTDTLLPGQQLSAGKELFSRASETNYSKGIFRLKMQTDGNLVQYPTDSADAADFAYYSTATSRVGSKVTLNLENDGHLFLLNSTANIQNITQGERLKQKMIYLMRLDVDGIFRVYSHSLGKGNWSAQWSSTDNRCDPKGRCGLNQVCVVMDLDVSCHCLPGFSYINEGDPSFGCEKKFTAISCKAVNRNVSYIMQRAENIIWMNDAYSSPNLITIEDCEQKCLEDCNCEAALFEVEEHKCLKQMVPLRYGRRNAYRYTIALIKVGQQAPISTELPAGIIREKRKEVGQKLLIGSISLILLSILVLVTAGIVSYISRPFAYTMINKNRNGEINDDVSLREFSYAELVHITNNFQEELGKGASGTVYKGILPYSQIEVAVKKLEKELAEGEREFQTEMKVIAKTHHRNLVCLLGYCIDGKNRLLVYEFMGNGTLADILFTTEDRLSWTDRVGIAIDIVKGILYLHEECKTQIIHCDINPQNILMDENMCAKISDFGLAKRLKQDQTRTYTAVRGTKGYVAPEWFRKLPVTVKADVYSFGIVLLEIICHRRNVDWNLPEGESVLDEWVYNCFVAGEVHKLIQDEEVEFKKLERWVKVGIWCIQDEPSLRPSMKKVLLMLEGTVEVPIPPSPSSFLSSF